MHEKRRVLAIGSGGMKAKGRLDSRLALRIGTRISGSATRVSLTHDHVERTCPIV
jgi:hypothetical protein